VILAWLVARTTETSHDCDGALCIKCFFDVKSELMMLNKTRLQGCLQSFDSIRNSEPVKLQAP
jgi:hypothetical protein